MCDIVPWNCATRSFRPVRSYFQATALLDAQTFHFPSTIWSKGLVFMVIQLQLIHYLSLSFVVHEFCFHFGIPITSDKQFEVLGVIGCGHRLVPLIHPDGLDRSTLLCQQVKSNIEERRECL